LLVVVACGSAINVSLLLLGRDWRFVLLVELTAAVWAYWAWRYPRVGRLRAPVVWAAVALLALAAASTAWSVDPHLTALRTAALALTLAAGLGLASVGAGRPSFVAGILVALLIGAAAVALLGLLILSVSHDLAVQPASTQYPARYRGVGQNPNTAALLLALAVPLSLWAFDRARSFLGKSVAVLAFVLFDASIVASGARGPLLAGFAGSLGYLLVRARSTRASFLSVAVAVLVLALDAGLTQIPKALEPVQTTQSRPAPTAPQRNLELVRPLADEVGAANGVSIHRALLGTSGRLGAWRGALGQAAHRPLAGYGFGTEDRVFVDRYYGFDSSLPENSYIGTLLQLGVVGALAFAALLAAVAAAGVRALRGTAPGRLEAAACASVVAAGLVLALTQSYLTSVGNVATVTFWVAALLPTAKAVVHPSADCREA
jgi:O-antigen ligase